MTIKPIISSVSPYTQNPPTTRLTKIKTSITRSTTTTAIKLLLIVALNFHTTMIQAFVLHRTTVRTRAISILPTYSKIPSYGISKRCRNFHHQHYHQQQQSLPLVFTISSSSYSRTAHRFLSSSSLSSSQQQEQEIRTLAPGSHVSEMEVKKSRFVAYAKHAETWEEAQEYINEIKELHPKARHWCYGFQCGVNPISERCSDDGEPTGTAGVPILGGIKGEELSDVVCVVVRYFGGIKLGAGGLIRAYGGAARQVLREAPVDILIPKSTFRVKVESSYVGSIYDSVAKVGGVTGGEEYGADASLTVTITCDLQYADQLRATLTDATRGSVEFL